MSDALRSIHKCERAYRVRFLAEFSYWIDCAERVGDVSEREEFHFRREQRRKLFKFESPIIANGDKAKPRPRSFGQQLPRHQVAVVLHHRQEDHIPFADKFSAPRLSHEVNAFGSSARENDFLGARRADVLRHALTRFFVSLRRTRTQRVQPAMHIGIVVLVKIAQRLDHRARFL